MTNDEFSPATLMALLNGDFENAIISATPGGIEAQEKRGQLEMVANQDFPLDIRGATKQQLEALGFVFGEKIDNLFQKAKLPDGWKIEPTDHSMWSTILDSDGNERGSIFYKAAFYDRCAFASIKV
jgi:hypothetical protein